MLFSKKPRTIFIGDVHGCLHEAREMIKLLKIRPLDRVIFLGDLINRGPDPAGVVHFVMENDFDCLMGNHEDEYLHEYTREDKYALLFESLGREAHAWLKRRPLFIETDRFLAVHAGVQPGKHPSQTRRGILLNIRTWDGSGRDIRSPENPPWYDFYSNSKPVFYGHWARRGLTLRENTFGLDSGCVYGRALSAYILEERKLVQLPAARQYYVPPDLR